MEMQQCVPLVLVMYVSLSTIQYTLCSYRNATVCYLFLCYCHQYKTHLVLHVKCLSFLSDLNQTWIFFTHFHNSLQYQMSWKYVQWELCWYMMTERREKANRCFLQLCKRAYQGHLMISGDTETMHGSVTKYKFYRSPSIARIVTFRKVRVGHVHRTEETRNAHRVLVEISLVKWPLIV